MARRPEPGGRGPVDAGRGGALGAGAGGGATFLRYRSMLYTIIEGNVTVAIFRVFISGATAVIDAARGAKISTNGRAETAAELRAEASAPQRDKPNPP